MIKDAFITNRHLPVGHSERRLPVDIKVAAKTQEPRIQDGVQITGPKAPEFKLPGHFSPSPTPAAPKAKESNFKSHLKKATVLAGGLAVGVGAAAIGMMGGAAGAIVGAVGGAALATAVTGAALAGAFVGLAQESPIVALALIAAGGAVAAALSPVLIGGAVAGALALGTWGTFGGPTVAVVAGLGCGLAGSAAVNSVQKKPSLDFVNSEGSFDSLGRGHYGNSHYNQATVKFHGNDANKTIDTTIASKGNESLKSEFFDKRTMVGSARQLLGEHLDSEANAMRQFAAIFHTDDSSSRALRDSARWALGPPVNYQLSTINFSSV